MAFIRERKRNDGSTAYAVTYRVGGRGTRQSSTSFPDEKQAKRFAALVDAYGPAEALAKAGIADAPQRTMSTLTVSEYLDRYIGNLTGVERQTIGDYRRFVRNDIGPAFGAVPLNKLTREDVSAWVNAMHAAGAANGTMMNKHGFLSSALKRAVEDGHLVSSPCDGVRVPRTEVPEMVFLTGDEYRTLKAAFSDYYQPLIEFLVASGCRAGEALALRPSDVDRDACTVRIQRAWKRDETAGGYYLGPPKTRRSVRTINVPASVLNQLDYSGQWLFTTTKGEAIKLGSWRSNVWYKSLRKAQANGLTKAPRIHDLRHTCASWMIARTVPLPVIQAHLGHESIKTTVDRYGHLDRTSHVAAADAIGKMLG